jgi:hypothetical protein
METTETAGARAGGFLIKAPGVGDFIGAEGCTRCATRMWRNAGRETGRGAGIKVN